jgi:hypothetical protein
MSTLYAIFRRENVERDENGCAIYEDDEDYYIIGRTHCFTSNGEIIQKHLKDDTPVYAIDNGSRIRTIKELREYYE